MTQGSGSMQERSCIEDYEEDSPQYSSSVHASGKRPSDNSRENVLHTHFGATRDLSTKAGLRDSTFREEIPKTFVHNHGHAHITVKSFRQMLEETMQALGLSAVTGESY